jgi:hypothetical protein
MRTMPRMKAIFLSIVVFIGLGLTLRLAQPSPKQAARQFTSPPGVKALNRQPAQMKACCSWISQVLGDGDFVED